MAHQLRAPRCGCSHPPLRRSRRLRALTHRFVLPRVSRRLRRPAEAGGTLSAERPAKPKITMSNMVPIANVNPILRANRPFKIRLPCGSVEAAGLYTSMQGRCHKAKSSNGRAAVEYSTGASKQGANSKGHPCGAALYDRSWRTIVQVRVFLKEGFTSDPLRLPWAAETIRRNLLHLRLAHDKHPQAIQLPGSE